MMHRKQGGRREETGGRRREEREGRGGKRRKRAEEQEGKGGKREGRRPGDAIQAAIIGEGDDDSMRIERTDSRRDWILCFFE